MESPEERSPWRLKRDTGLVSPSGAPQCWHRVFEGTAVAIEAISLDVGDQSLPPTKTETDSEGGLDPTVESIGVVE